MIRVYTDLLPSPPSLPPFLRRQRARDGSIIRVNNEDEKRSIRSLSARNTRSCKAVASEADVVNTGIANANDPCKYTTIRKEETCKLSIRLGVFSRIDRRKNREFSTNLSLSLSLSIVSIRRGNFQRRGMYVSRYLINGTFDIFARFNRATRVNESG